MVPPGSKQYLPDQKLAKTQLTKTKFAKTKYAKAKFPKTQFEKTTVAKKLQKEALANINLTTQLLMDALNQLKDSLQHDHCSSIQASKVRF